MQLRDCGAIVTGGASGLGEAVARALVAGGAFVTIIDRDTDRGEALASELGERAAFAVADITRDDEVAVAVHSAAQFGPLRILVSCAGLGGGVRTLDRTGKIHSRTVWDRIIGVNLLGTFLVMTHAVQHIAQTESLNSSGQRGVVVNTASIAAYDGQIGQLAYAASKAAVVGMTLPAARDLASAGIRVCTIAPGTMDTPMLGKLDESARQALADDVVHPRRLGSPAEFAALTLAIIDNDYLNGETIRLDGALRMAPK